MTVVVPSVPASDGLEFQSLEGVPGCSQRQDRIGVTTAPGTQVRSLSEMVISHNFTTLKNRKR